MGSILPCDDSRNVKKKLNDRFIALTDYVSLYGRAIILWIVFGGGFLVFNHYLPQFRQVKETPYSGWIVSEATILESSIFEQLYRYHHAMEIRTSIKIELQYQTFDGKWQNGSCNVQNELGIIKKSTFDRGRTIIVRYNPDNPKIVTVLWKDQDPSRPNM